MAEIIIGERVINKAKETGTIISHDDKYICVDFGNRTAKFPLSAFDQGFLKYEKTDLQTLVNKGIQQIKDEKDQEDEKKRLAEEKTKNVLRMMEAQAPAGTKFNSVSVRLDAASVTLSSFKKKHKAKVQEVFNECDNDMEFFCDSFQPSMRYIVPRNYSYTRREYLRSRYCVGYVTKYSDTYVFRVISRNDIYTPGMYGGFTVTHSDTTEVIRVLCIDGEVYCFSKNLSCEGGKYKNSTLFKKWQASAYIRLVDLNEVIRKCDCEYLNDYIEEKDVNCLGYVKLFMAAIHNNKAEILFKNKLFRAVLDIDNIRDYLKEFSPKQIDFASKNDVIHTLPLIKSLGVFDTDILKEAEKLMIGTVGHRIYDIYLWYFNRYNFDLSVLDKKIFAFLRKVIDDMGLNRRVYIDYLRNLRFEPNVTIDDVFDKDYVNRHYTMMAEKKVCYSIETENQYRQIAQELSWIDREENGYYITIPKTISEFKYEGHMQHHCVYTMEYFYDVIDRRSIIVFLRQEKNTPYVTIEFDYETFEVRQAYRKFNQRIDKELYQYIVDLGKQLKLETMSKE